MNSNVTTETPCKSQGSERDMMPNPDTEKPYRVSSLLDFSGAVFIPITCVSFSFDIFQSIQGQRNNTPSGGFIHILRISNPFKLTLRDATKVSQK